MTETIAPLAPPNLYLEPAVCMQEVSFFRGGNEVLVNIDLDVNEGVFLGIIGPNGGGKTTLLNLILGTLKPTHGFVEVFGRKPGTARLRKLIGYVPQYQPIPSQFPATVYDVVLMGAYGASGLGWPVKREYKAHAHHLLAQVRLDDVMRRPFSHLSGGQQQRAYIARALVTYPRLLLLDEPLRGLDATAQSHFIDLLLDLKKDYELTVIMVSHHVGHLARFSERIACLNKSIHWHDRPELINPEVLSHTYNCELDAVFAQEAWLNEHAPTSFKQASDSTEHEHSKHKPPPHSKHRRRKKRRSPSP